MSPFRTNLFHSHQSTHLGKEPPASDGAGESHMLTYISISLGPIPEAEKSFSFFINLNQYRLAIQVTREAEAGEILLQGQPGMRAKCKARLNNLVRYCHKIKS